MTVLGKASATAMTARAVSTTRCPTTFTSSSSSLGIQKSTFTSSSDSDTNSPTSVVWSQPNQTTLIYQRMEMKCPQVMTEYAKCVINKQNEGALIRGACDEKFIAVMDCFKSVR